MNPANLSFVLGAAAAMAYDKVLRGQSNDCEKPALHSAEDHKMIRVENNTLFLSPDKYTRLCEIGMEAEFLTHEEIGKRMFDLLGFNVPLSVHTVVVEYVS